MRKFGTPLTPNERAEREYRTRISAVTLAMQKSVIQEFKKSDALLEGGDEALLISRSKSLQSEWDRILLRMGGTAATSFVIANVRSASVQFVHSVGKMISEGNPSLTLAGKLINEGNIAFVEEAVRTNVSLIRSIGEKYFGRIEKSIIENNGRWDLVYKDLLEMNGQNKRAAMFIARDQSHKLHAQITMENMKRAGIRKMKWLHSGAGKQPREFHKRKWDGKSEPPNGLNGYIFDINNPPVSDLKTGERSGPGYLINCRCVGVPVLDF